jgi:uncharacterized protein YbjT (DUF2867 family)
MKIAITTPTGHIGRQLTKLLLDKGGHKLTLLCRDPAKVKEFTDRGATAIRCDQANAEQVIRGTEGAEAVFFVCPPKFDAQDLRAFQNKVGDNLADAVRKNSLKRVVFISSLGAQHADGTGPIAGLHDIEAKLNHAAKDVAGNVTHLRPAFFMENWFMNADTIKQQGAVYAPISPDVKIPMIATADIAKVAADVLTDTSWKGINVRELVGPHEYSYADGAKIIGQATGKTVQFQQVPGDAARDSMTKMGLSPNVASGYVQMYDGFNKGLVKPEKTKQPENVTQTTLEEFAKQQIGPALQ